MNASRSLPRRMAALGGAVALIAAVIGGSLAVITADTAAASSPITQVAPTSATVTAGTPYSVQLNVTGNSGPVTFFTTSAVCEPITVSSTGQLTAPGTIPPGVYDVFGFDQDTSSNSGTWLFDLTVTGGGPGITQIAPTGGSVAAGSTLTDQLNTTGVNPVAFTVTSSSPAFTVSSTGAVSVPGTLAANTYIVSGTDSDVCGSTGTWSYTLTVSPGTITQIAPFGGSVAAGHTFTDQLATTGNHGAVTFTVTSSSPAFAVSSTGAVSVPGTLAANTYIVSGTDTDPLSDTGTWSYTLTVSPGTITQIAPFGGSVAAGHTFTDQLATTGNHGAVTFTVTSSSPAFAVSSTGAVSVPGTLAANTYIVSGTDTDPLSDTGTWSYTLTVSPGTITQIAPFGGSVAAGHTFTDQLATTGNHGAVTFTVTSSSPAFAVSSTGAVSVPGTLAANTYIVSGTDTDPLSDTGTWSYTLTVSPGTITQIAPFGGSVAAGHTFTDQLATTGNHGAVTFTVTSSSPAFAVSSTGAVSVPGTLAANTYIVSGTDTDPLSDTGTWSYTLVVSNGGITQIAPFGGSVAAGHTFTDQLATTGNHGAVTFTVTSSSPAFAVSSTGAVSVPGTLAANTYIVSGTDTDPLSDTGTWSYTLTVSPGTITQIAPFGGSVAAGHTFTDQLATTGNHGAVTFTVTSSSPAFAVSSTGAVSVPGTLAANTYIVSGTDTDPLSDTGTWSYTLTVSPGTITQIAPFGGSVAAGHTFTDQLATTGNHGAVTFTVTSSSPAFAVSSTGAVSVPGTLAANTYIVSGTDTDPLSDTGTWSYTLTVSNGGVTQTAPTSGIVTQGNPFADQLTTSDVNPVTFTVTSSSPAFTVSSTGAVSAPGTLAVGHYIVSGTDSDTLSNTGTWSFTLTVSSRGVTQTAPTSGSVSTGNPFTSQLHTSGNNGAVTFTVTSASPALVATSKAAVPAITVSSSGAISASGSLAPGVYTVSGTDSDALGNTGTWSFTLTVSSVARSGIGYTLVATDGGVFTFGTASFHGSTGDLTLNRPIVGMAATPDGKGYWLVASDGGIFAFGDAVFYGSTGDLTLNRPIVGMAATPDGKGYWLVASDGGIFAFGDAVFHGSTGNITLNRPIVGMAATPDGKGYWLVASDGGTFAFGDAVFHGSTGNITLNRPIVGMAATPGGKGYWLVASDGGIFAFGDAAFYGSTGDITLNRPIGGMAATPDGKGYWLVASDGGIFAYGDAAFQGSTGNIVLNRPIVGMSA